MKRIIFLFAMVFFIASCQDSQTKATSESPNTATASVAPIELPYKATYSSNFTTDVSDADLKMVLMSYKEWADGNISNLSQTMSDSITVIFNNGDFFNGTNAELMKRWGTYRDSLSTVTIEMQAWQKLYEPDKKETAIITWYKEVDTYKTGKVDSAFYHDINGIKNGKINYYAQYKRPAK